MSKGDNNEDLTIGERVRLARQRRGLSRRAVAELAGRTEEWLRQIETGERPVQRIDTLQLLARVLKVRDISELTGSLFVMTKDGSRPQHGRLAAVRRALRPHLSDTTTPSPDLAALRRSIQHADTAWLVSRQQITALGLVLPELLSAAIAAQQSATGQQRREALRLLVEVYRLTDNYLRHAGDRQLAAQVCDRMLLAAQEADDPELISLSAYKVAAAAQNNDEPEEALTLAMDAVKLFRPWLTSGDHEALALWGSLHLCASTSAARLRRGAEADRLWSIADEAAKALGPNYHHPATIFGQLNCGIHAVDIALETGRSSDAVERSANLNVSAVPSASRRARHFIDLARAFYHRRDRAAAVGALLTAERQSTEVVTFNQGARRLMYDLLRAKRPEPEVLALAGRMRVIA
ncbi:hypothetical protein TH66_10300 [Carbonactinospora thermoautotrophica]|uniref:HTH cro/C1-type domain-containing protein n=1 Tax=Carbonactinospora thermoautotrophica TaxID=1469144 RepID=A0A132NHR3_9ACTN|nr:helix-turn-helix transcriptional regulator [Carbonactinospora thermoautotrophica]KWX03348.1 hypothetical protein TH66_10300 [Carbonactinospora thermoautotrophica]KWX09598.1 hypothetical protein TR74_08630 [Carbonactinospora thermoautotrophica]